MASGFFALFDDIAMLLDDAAMMSKVAAKKTAGLLGDDLAVNAEKATGFNSSRELPVIWAITKGSFINKAIILPLAFLLSAFVPSLIVPILLIGGAYLSYEGAEKVLEWITGHKAHPKAHTDDASEDQDPIQREAVKIKSAIRTDFILSIEIIIITLGTVISQSFPIQLLVVTFIALLATVGVYGLVALLVRMDDFGFYLIEASYSMKGFKECTIRPLGALLVRSLPRVIRLLSVIGTIAMLLVGGGMYVHNIEAVHHLVEVLPAIFGELITGLVVGAVLLLVAHGIKMVRKTADA